MVMEEASEQDDKKVSGPDVRRRRQRGESGSDTGSSSELPKSGSSPSPPKRRKSSFSSSSGGADSGSTLQERWEEMYERLKSFKAETGHCNVPNRYTKDPQLGFWVSTQRRQYRVLTSGGSTSSALTVQRAQKLVNLGFEWSAKDPRMVPWETRFRQLQEYATKNGHAQIPIGWQENVPLSNWVSKQRQEYKLLQKGKPSRLSQERIDLLNSIGFVWEAKRGAPRQAMMAGDAAASSVGEAKSSPAQQKTSVTPQNRNTSPPPTVLSTKASSRGMRPASPKTNVSSKPYAIPVARLPPARASRPYYEDFGYPPPGGYPPSIRESYYPPFPSQSIYAGTMHPSYPASPIGTRPHESSHSPPTLAYSQAGTWQMPRTGRILTPVYPMEPPRHTYPMSGPPDSPYYEARPGPRDTAEGSGDRTHYPHFPFHQAPNGPEGGRESSSGRRRGEEERRRTEYGDSHPEDRNRQR